MTSPLLTIGMPIYKGGRNGGQMLRRALKSLLAQTYEDFEVIMVDNDSQDDTEEIIKEVVGSDSRFTYFRNAENFGFYFNAYRLLTATQTRYMCEFHFDSYWAPAYAEKCLALLEKDSQAVLAYSWCQFVDDDGGFLDLAQDRVSFAGDRPEERYLNILNGLGWCTAFHGIMRHAPAVRHFLKTLPTFNAAFDNEFLALMALEGKLVQIEEPLFFRYKDSYQRKGEILKERFNRLYFENPSYQKPFFLPFCRWIRDYCRDVANFSLPLASKDSLIRQTVSALLKRYRQHLEYEITRAVDLLLEGDFKKGLASREEAPQDKYKYLDFVFLSELSLDLEYASLLLPDFGRLNLALAAAKINLGRQLEALPLLDRQAELTPHDYKTQELRGHLKNLLKSKSDKDKP